MNNLKNELIYQWRQLKDAVKGGYQETKKLLNYQDLKEKFMEGLKNIKEQDQYEKEQKRYRKKQLLNVGDIVTFNDTECYGNVLKARITKVERSVFGIYAKLEILESYLRYKYDFTLVEQIEIMENLIKLEKAEN